MLCQLVRRRDVSENWTWVLYVRLWDGHPWLGCTRQLQRIADCWVRRSPAKARLLEVMCGVTVLPSWVMVVVDNPQTQLSADYIREPDQYWYREDLPKRDRKHYRLAVTYMESLCSQLCETLNSPP